MLKLTAEVLKKPRRRAVEPGQSLRRRQLIAQSFAGKEKLVFAWLHLRGMLRCIMTPSSSGGKRFSCNSVCRHLLCRYHSDADRAVAAPAPSKRMAGCD